MKASPPIKIAVRLIKRPCLPNQIDHMCVLLAGGFRMIILFLHVQGRPMV